MTIILDVIANPRLNIVRKQERAWMPKVGRSIDDALRNKSADSAVAGMERLGCVLALDEFNKNRSLVTGKVPDDLNERPMLIPFFIGDYGDSGDEDESGQEEPYCYIRIMRVGKDNSNTGKLAPKQEYGSKCGGDTKQGGSGFINNICNRLNHFF
ncbi:MAG: hypothetical protein QM500_00755 [Methylococcales bacterium]